MRRLVRSALVKGGVILFRGAGTAARRYLESDRATADEYYLEAGTAVAEFTVTGAHGEAVDARSLSPEEYAAWVDWIDPITGTSMGTPRGAGEGMRGSPRFAEMVINAPKSLSIAAALHPEVSDALDAAQRDAATEIRRWLAQHSVTRVGPRNAREVVPVQRLQTVAVAHKTSRAGDPHRHIHFQIGTRVYAAGKWRGLDTAALFKQQGAIRALGTAVIAAHPQLAQVLDAHGLTLDPATGEVAELEPYNLAMSKRGAQVERNLAMFEAEWEKSHPREEPGPVMRGRLRAKAWDHQRPNKKPTALGSEERWRRELEDAGYTPGAARVRRSVPVALDELQIQEVASRALDRCASGASAWTVHTLQEQVTRITTEHGVHAAPDELREFVQLATLLAAEECFSVLPPGRPTPEHVAHLTSLRVVAAETELRDLLAVRGDASTKNLLDVHHLAGQAGLDEDQARAAAALASANALVVVEGAAGSGKTTMLKVAIKAAQEHGRSMRVVTPTKKAADVAAQDLGISTDSVASLVFAHGFRWNADGVWTRLSRGDIDRDSGATYRGPAREDRLARGERIVVDEAGMLDQDTALALLCVADEAGATVALVGDRAQLPAVGRGGVLDIAAQLTPAVFEMTSLHRFSDATYSALTLELRHGRDPATTFDQLNELGLIELHESEEDVRDVIARSTSPEDSITTATNEEAQVLNERIRAERVERGEVDEARTIFGSDGLPIGVGDVIQTRRNDSAIGVANRQTWTVQHVTDTGDVLAVQTANGRKRQRTVTLPAEYVMEDVRLAYAVTAYGVQSVTVNTSHTVLTDALDAAGVYVGMTRGRDSNILHIVAADLDDAREQFTEALIRDRADRGLAEATERAREGVAGLIADGPVALVNAERDRIAERIAKAEQETAHWMNALAALREQSQRHETEREQRREVVNTADAHAAQVFAEVVEPLVQQAIADGSAYLDAQEHAFAAHRAQAGSGRFRKRTAARTAKEADAARNTAERALRDRWRDVPHSEAGMPLWAQMVAQREADVDPRLIEAKEQAKQTHQAASDAANQHTAEDATLSRRVLRGSHSRAVTVRIEKLRKQVAQDHRYLLQLDALPPAEAAQLVRERVVPVEVQRLVAEEARNAPEARAAQLRHVDGPSYERGRGHDSQREGPTLGR
jgi:thymidine kinase